MASNGATDQLAFLKQQVEAAAADVDEAPLASPGIVSAHEKPQATVRISREGAV
jgi:hypothetical protein